ncbi:hypothetical protein J0670_32135, partial [Streptomyces sp. FH025]|nr:hypothetical protein [Streptomyces sp. FH025]
MAVLPDLVHVRREIAVVEGDVEPAVVAVAGDAPEASTLRGPRQVDARPGAGPLSALALSLGVGAALTCGGQLGLVLPLGLLATPQELGPALVGLALQFQETLTGGLAASCGFLAAGQRGQGLGFVAGGPGLGEVGAVVAPGGERGASVGGGDDVAVLVLVEKSGRDDQLDDLSAHAAALRPVAGPGRDQPVAGAVPPDPAVGVLAGGRRDEGVDVGGPPGLVTDLGVPRGGEEAADVGFVVVGVEAGSVVGVVAVGPVVADLCGATGVAVAAPQAPHLPAFAAVAAWADADRAGVA